MDALASVPRNTGNIGGIALTPPNSNFDVNNAMAVVSYRRADGSELSREVHFDLKILSAVKRWTSHDDVQIEFYAAGGSGDIRVKIINHEAGEKTCDMSLAAFMGSSPTMI